MYSRMSRMICIFRIEKILYYATIMTRYLFIIFLFSYFLIFLFSYFLSYCTGNHSHTQKKLIYLSKQVLSLHCFRLILYYYYYLLLLYCYLVLLLLGLTLTLVTI